MYGGDRDSIEQHEMNETSFGEHQPEYPDDEQHCGGYEQHENLLPL